MVFPSFPKIVFVRGLSLYVVALRFMPIEELHSGQSALFSLL